MAVVGGLVVAIGLMIGATLRDLIEFGDPEGASDLVEDRDRAGVDGVAAER